jgi:hypothetical protein
MADTFRLPEASDSERAMLAIYEAAYAGWEEDGTLDDSPHSEKQVLTTSQIEDGNFLRLWKPRNLLAKVVEEPVGYLLDIEPRLEVLSKDGVALNPEEEAGAKKISSIADFFETKIRPRLRDLILWQGLYGMSFAKPTYEPADALTGRDAALHVIPYPRWENGGERANAFFESEDPDRVTLGVVFWSKEIVVNPEKGETKLIPYAQILKQDEIVWLTKESGSWQLWPDGSLSGNGRDTHKWQAVPLAVLWNDGKPDVADGLDTQGVINKDVYDMNALSDSMAFPQRWRKGLIPTGGWPRDPLTGNPRIEEPLETGPGILWDIPEDGDMGQLDSADGTYISEKFKTDKLDLSILCRSLAVQASGNSHGTTASGESKQMDATNLLAARLDGKADQLGKFLTELMALIRQMGENDPNIAAVLPAEVMEFEVKVRYDVEIGKDAIRERELDQADRTAGAFSQYTYLRRLGFTPQEARDEIERVGEEKSAEQERNQEMAAKDPIVQAQLNGRAGAPAEPGNLPKPKPANA